MWQRIWVSRFTELQGGEHDGKLLRTDDARDEKPKARDEGLKFQNPWKDVGGCQNYGPFLGPYYNTAPTI